VTARISAATSVYAVLGDPVEHSLSPVVQNEAIRATGVDGVYTALRCGDAELPGLMRGLALAGGGGNVTLPHKEAAARALDVATTAVKRTGACNTFWAEDGKLHGDNTDVDGFRGAVAALLSGRIWGGRVLLLGAGGAARAVIVALLDDGIEEVMLVNRTPERARSLAGRAGDPRVRVVEDTATLEDASVDLVVNATTLGLDRSDPLPVAIGALGSVGAVLDLVYGGDAVTRLVEEARERGIPAADGAEMLVGQGAAAFARWWGRPAPVEVMRQALAEARGVGS